MRSRPRRRWLRRLAAVFLVLLVAGAAPILYVETQCVGRLEKAASDYKPILPPEHRRNLVDTYLTYPEWSIVHAYEDFAGVLRRESESRFPYLDSILGYWRNLCDIAAVADSHGTISTEVRVMLYTIGLSFTGEMGVKGLYESTIGRLTEWIRGPQRTAEDEFALRVATEYAVFLRQTPWYEFPFGETLGRFWSEMPLTGGSLVRKIERRIALSLEFGVKSFYARAIGFGAGLAPAALTIRSVVTGIENLEADPGAGIKLIKRLPDGATIIETPRYRAFTEIARGLAGRGGDFVEIAGNDEIFVTVLAPAPFAPKSAARQLLSIPSGARPGWTRLGFTVAIADLTGLMREAKQQGAEFEHVYDY